MVSGAVALCGRPYSASSSHSLLEHSDFLWVNELATAASGSREF